MPFEECPYCGASLELTGAPQRCPGCGRALPGPDDGVIDIRAAEPERAPEAEVVAAEPVFDDEGYGPSEAYRPQARVRVFRYEGNYADHSGCCCGLGCFLFIVFFALALQGLASLF